MPDNILVLQVKPRNCTERTIPEFQEILFRSARRAYLKYLRVSTDMYDVSRAFMRRLSGIRSLEHLEFCFNYREKVSPGNMQIHLSHALNTILTLRKIDTTGFPGQSIA